MTRLLLLHDPTPGRDTLRAFLAEQRHVVIAGEAGAPERARMLLAHGNYDAVLLTARLGGQSANELLPIVRRGARIIVATTPEEEIARALEAAGVDVLPAPYQPTRLAQIIARLGEPTGSTAPFAGTGPLIPAKLGAEQRFLRPDGILLVAADENYTKVSLVSGERLMIRRTMNEWAKLLPPTQFIRIHRGLFLNLQHVARVERLGPALKLHFGDVAASPITLTRRRWPALRGKLEAWRTQTGDGASGRAVTAPPAPPAVLGTSVAVLPFANLSTDPTNELFCDGISEELLNVLAKIPDLQVAARTSSFSFKGKNRPVTDIARQLAVEFIVEGSVRRSGSRARITAQLIKGSDGFHVWSDNFDRELTDIFLVQDEIAGLIAENLQLTFGRRSHEATMADPAAHWLVLEGRHFWNLRTHDAFARAEAAYRRALDREPQFAPAHAGLANVAVVRAMYRLADGVACAADDLTHARTAAHRALELDPALAEPHAALAFADFHEGRMAPAERAFARALALNPSYATGYQFYAWALCAQGKLDRALNVYARAITLDPLSFINLDRHAAMLTLAGNYRDALAANERAAALRPDLFVGNVSQRAPILLALGRRDEAIAAARAVRHTPFDVPFRRNSDADALFVLHSTGHTTEAADYGNDVLARLPADNYLRGFVFSALGRFDEAIPSLERAPTIMQPFLYWSAMWDPVRGQPAFQHLIARLGRTAEYQLARTTLAQMRRADPA